MNKAMEQYGAQDLNKKSDNEKGATHIRLENSVNDDIRLKEYLFREIVEKHARKDFEQAMKGFGYSEEEIGVFEDELDKLGDGAEKVLSWPWELRNKFLPNFKKDINEGKKTVQDMVKKVFEVGSQNNSRIAYHCSLYDIAKDNKKGEWVVWGSEIDHRDNDQKMAYYSFDYYNLYREKNPRYLYLISSHRKTTAHKTDGVSGRAKSLDIIAKLDLREVDAEVANNFKEYREVSKRKVA